MLSHLQSYNFIINITFFFTFTRLWQFRQHHKKYIMESFISIPVVAVDGAAPILATQIKNVRFIEGYGAPTAGEITQFSTALSAITIVRDDQNTSTRASRFLSSLTPAQVTAAILAANTNTPGLGLGGKATLVAGTLAITIPGLTSTNDAITGIITPANGSLTVKFQAVCTTNTLTITALLAAGTINTADTSVVAYSIVA